MTGGRTCGMRRRELTYFFTWWAWPMLSHVVGDVTTHAGFTTTWLEGLPPSGCLVVRPWINSCPKATLKLVSAAWPQRRFLDSPSVAARAVLHSMADWPSTWKCLRWEWSGEACDNNNVVVLLSAWCCVITFWAFVHAHISSLAGKVCSLIQLLASTSHVSAPAKSEAVKYLHRDVTNTYCQRRSNSRNGRNVITQLFVY